MTLTLISPAADESTLTKTSTLPRLMCFCTTDLTASSAKRKLLGIRTEASRYLLFTLLSSTVIPKPSTVPFALP